MKPSTPPNFLKSESSPSAFGYQSLRPIISRSSLVDLHPMRRSSSTAEERLHLRLTTHTHTWTLQCHFKFFDLSTVIQSWWNYAKGNSTWSLPRLVKASSYAFSKASALSQKIYAHTRTFFSRPRWRYEDVRTSSSSNVDAFTFRLRWDNYAQNVDAQLSFHLW